jgi:hypothetical protein
VDALASELRTTIRGEADILEAAFRFNIHRSTVFKLLEGRPLSLWLKKKICAHLVNGGVDERSRRRMKAGLARLEQVNRLYREKGSLAAVGRELGVTRERVRQLMRQGSQLGLFEFNPYKPPVISKRTLLKDYKKRPSLRAVAEIHRVSGAYIAKLFSSYGIASGQLHALRLSGTRAAKKRRLIASYRQIKRKLGHDPTTTELERRSKEWHGLYPKIVRQWGSIHAFRSELGIPPGKKRLFAAWQRDPRFADLVAAERARRKERLVERYRNVEKELGKYPSTMQLRRGPKCWSRLYNKIRYQWGTFDAFRKHMGIWARPRNARRPW